MTEEEVVVAACHDREEDTHALFVYSSTTGALVQQLRDAQCLHSRVVAVKDRYVVGRHATKPAVCVWEWGRETPIHVCYVAERLVSLAADSSGTYLVGGGPSGTLYLWHVPTGEFLCSWKGHFRPVSQVTFAEGELMLVTSGEDALVHVWSLIDVLGSRSRTQHSSQKPILTWSEHSLPVTDLCCSRAGGAASLVVSASLDHSCRVWQLDRKHSLCIVSCPSPLLCCTVDALEEFVYAGGKDGNIFEKALLGGRGDATLLGEGVSRTFRGHRSAVTSVSCSSRGRSLISSSEDGVIYFWNRENGERMRTIARESPLSYATVLLASSLDHSSFKERHPALLPFKKYKSTDEDLHVKVKTTLAGSALQDVCGGMPDFPCAAYFRTVDLDDSLGEISNGGLSLDGRGRNRNRNRDRNRDDGNTATGAARDPGTTTNALREEENRKLREELRLTKLELEKNKERLGVVESQVLDLLQAKNAFSPFE